MKNTESATFFCSKHNDHLAESRCKDCNEYLCVDCSIEHNVTHKVVVLKQEAMQFARSVINKTFTPTEEVNCSKAALDKLMELTNSHNELQSMVKQAKQKLVHVGAELNHEIETLHTKANTITQDLVNLKNTNTGHLCEEIKELVNQRDYYSVYKKKEQFEHIIANRDALDNSQLEQLLKQMKKYKKSINKLLASLATRPDENMDQDFDMPELNRIVGRLDSANNLILYNVATKRRKTIRPKNFQLHECCECIEARGSIFITGGKDDDRDTFEYQLEDTKGEINARAEMNQGRCNHALCLLKDTFIYCAGGVYDKTTINKCERYDIDKDEWEGIPSLNDSKHNGTMCTLADRYIFFVGGGKIGHSSLFSTLEVLDTVGDNSWEKLTVDIGKSRWVPCECTNAIAISRSEILIFGGWEKEKDTRSTAFIYNYSTNSMTKLACKMKSTSAFFYRLPPILLNGKVYAMASDESIHTFNIKTQEWEMIEPDDWKDEISLEKEKPFVLTGRILRTLQIYEISQKYGHKFTPKNTKFNDCSEGVVVNEIIYVIGGENDAKTTLAVDMRSYKREVIIKANLNIGRYNHAVEGVRNEWIYCCGGCAGREMLAACEKYSIKDDKWLFIPKLNEAKQNITLCVTNNYALFCIGGGLIGHETLYDTVEKLDLFDEEAGWTRINIGHDESFKPIECIGSTQINPYQIMLFGGWKPNRNESGKCFIFDIYANDINRMVGTKLPIKTGFYYTLRPYNNMKKIHCMDPAFNVGTFDIKTKQWEAMKKDEWLEEEKKEANDCTIF